MTQDALFEFGPAAVPARVRPPKPADVFAAVVPEWVRFRIQVTNPARLSANGPAALVPCDRCGLPVLHGPNIQESGVEDLTADLTDLDAAAELDVLLAGRGTIEVEPGRYGVRLFGRDHWLIRKPASSRGRFAAPSHACFRPAGTPVPWEQIFIPNHERSNHDCPF